MKKRQSKSDFDNQPTTPDGKMRPSYQRIESRDGKDWFMRGGECLGFVERRGGALYAETVDGASRMGFISTATALEWLEEQA